MSEILQKITSFCKNKRAILISLIFACVATLTIGAVAANAEGLFIKSNLFSTDYRESDSYDIMVDDVNMYSMSYYYDQGFGLAGLFINGKGLFIKSNLFSTDYHESDSYDIMVDDVNMYSMSYYYDQGFGLAGSFQ
ncbi:MAG: hypothetical protein U9R60_06440 [Bacteroidota bacterium]|nr:hypothetical protein [Bacteroidota bacterium]